MKNLFIILLLTSSFLVKAQQKQDTLFIKYDNRYLKKVQNPITKEYKYFINDEDNDSEYMFFLEKKTYTNLKTYSKIHCLKKLLRKSKVYNKKKLDDYIFFNFLSSLSKKNIYFLKKENLFIEFDLIMSIDN
ncbi:hypothetical protein Q4517_15145 [Tenacibaculum sp. 1_MG-2023]|uniref:hypothetical protein n=1 Tax=Tenacibaculum sp. 1_MG-2023 TaxID=3062653 RepID=UPI0026E26186|nr:hypothetical protein [Tenacibaculum sp. 1_MG-2023]MDO6676876.1 hypothetical protein [Tenacibaculum sp. 1_MG-2023]